MLFRSYSNSVPFKIFTTVPKLHVFMLFEIFITISQLCIFMLKNDKGQRSPRNALCWAKVKVKALSCVPLFATPWTVAYQAPPGAVT